MQVWKSLLKSEDNISFQKRKIMREIFVVFVVLVTITFITINLISVNETFPQNSQ